MTLPQYCREWEPFFSQIRIDRVWLLGKEVLSLRFEWLTGSESCPMASFGITALESLGSTSRNSVRWKKVYFSQPTERTSCFCSLIQCARVLWNSICTSCSWRNYIPARFSLQHHKTNMAVRNFEVRTLVTFCI